MTIIRFVASEDCTIVAIDGANIALESIAQVRYMTAPFEVTGQIAQRYTESGEHHHGNVDRGREECAILVYERFFFTIQMKLSVINRSNLHLPPHRTKPR